MMPFTLSLFSDGRSSRRVGVMGLGQTGWSAVRWLHAQGCELVVVDTRENPPHHADLLRDYPDVPCFTGAVSADVFREVDWVLLSPGVSPHEAALVVAREHNIPLLGDIEVGARIMNLAVRRPVILAVTGANGKSTVVTLLGRMAEEQGKAVAVAGNIGVPLLEVLSGKSWPDVLVLELSSFQLETLQSLEADAAVVLNVTEDHMDRYPDMTRYAAAKARIYQGCRHPVVNREDPWNSLEQAVSFGLDEPAEGHWGLRDEGKNGAWLAYGQHNILRSDELPLLGRHNVANALAALALGEAVGWQRDLMAQALRHASGLPHRVETVAVVNGVTYVDDSKGTNVGATVAALKGMGAPVVLIAGGDGKNQDFTPLGEAVRAHAKAVVLIGRDGPRMAQVLDGFGVACHRSNTLPEAVAQAAALAERGDIVLMSPACASFDMFRHYGHRAEVFRQAVTALDAGQEKR